MQQQQRERAPTRAHTDASSSVEESRRCYKPKCITDVSHPRGGRLDATHAWDGGVAAITNVDLDHTDRLGPTIKHIAREKAAIIERGDLAVTGTTGDALAIVRRRAARLGVPLTVVEPAPLLAQDRLLGVVSFGSTSRAVFHEADRELIRTFADQLAASGVAAVLGKPVSGVADRASHNRASMEATLERLAALTESTS